MKSKETEFPETTEVLERAAKETGFLLQRSHRKLRAALIEALKPLDISIGHFAILGLLSGRGALTQQQLIEILGTDKSSMVYLIDELEKQSLAERRTVPGDRRAYGIHLTLSGKARLSEAATIVKNVESSFLKPLNKTERAKLNELLWRISK